MGTRGKEDEDFTWVEFLKVFRARFISEVAMAAKEELLHMSQNGRSVQDFTQQFRLLEKYAPQMDDKRRAAQYIGKLDDYVRPYMQLKRNGPLDDIIEAAAIVECTRPRSSSSFGRNNDKKRKAPEGGKKS